MDSFEINKIIAAILLTALIVIGIGKFTDILFHVEKPKESAYKGEGLETSVAKTSSSSEIKEVEKVDIGQLLALGDLVRGEKVSAATDNLIYSNIGKYAARVGGIGINADYRLAPEAKWPDGAVDLRMIIQWVKDNVADYGGDPDNIFIMGNSAGATHIATYMFHEASQLPGGPGVKAAILSSGGLGAGSPAYYGEDAAQRAARSPLGLVDSYEGEQIPVYLWSAEYDPSNIETSVAEMYAKLCRKYADCPMYTQWQGYNHVSHVMSIDSEDTTITNGIIRFYHEVIGD